MKFRNYLKDKIYVILLFLFTYILLLLMFLAFKINISLVIVSSIIIILAFILILKMEYVRKRSFYTDLLSKIAHLDKSYLVLEMLDKPTFYEGKLLYEALYEINKSMTENIKNYELQMTNFKDYIEMWIHEVKMPLSSLVLMAHNHKDEYDKKLLEQLKRIENYLEQVLYYVRCENANMDYLIKEVPLDKVISQVALKNKDDLLENRIDLIAHKTNLFVYTDSKWLEFILNQIINNSIKYKKDIPESYIKISHQEANDTITLIIEDNGIGIPKADIPKVFNKSFTGYNGRIKAKSTGMGLFIAKNLCSKLGHQISLESKEGEYTKVIITIAKNKYYEVVK